MAAGLEPMLRLGWASFREAFVPLDADPFCAHSAAGLSPRCAAGERPELGYRTRLVTKLCR